MLQRLKDWLRPAVYLGQNPISLTGAILTTSAAVILIAFWGFLIERGGPVHPYYGMLFFLVLPAIFILGLILMPLGAWLRRRKLRASGQLPDRYPQVDLKSPVLRRALILILALTCVNFVIAGTATFQAVDYMDSNQFCGKTCHVPMTPEYTAYQNSPHSKVPCAECHIGEGAPWFVKAKISGARQLWTVATNTFSRPIPSPVHNLRPARDTCEHCHWPEKFTSDRLVIRTKYADDEANTPATSVLLIRIGGHSAQGLVGIHGRHLDRVGRITYVSIDGKRQVIPSVTYIDDTGKTVEYVSADIKATPEQLAKAEHRTMDCVDCHNRPTHTFEPPERALDKAMGEGRISAKLPFVKKEALAALKADYPDQPTAAQKIPAALADFYKTKYPAVYQDQRAAVDAAAEQVKAIYLRNVYPEMKLTWGTHPSNLGHEDAPGCFRCHDGKHKSADGKLINDDCGACHNVLAMEEKEPKVLSDLGFGEGPAPRWR
jgi:nitrate/TMAO reductase-like tetraheme cytochrome c subunit